jgi:hypothetical protein
MPTESLKVPGAGTKQVQLSRSFRYLPFSGLEPVEEHDVFGDVRVADLLASQR